MSSEMIKNLNVELYRKLYLVRASERKIIEHYFEDEMKTPMHMSMGAEAISVGICQALEPRDQVFGTYRSHALFLAKTGDTDDFFAEMYGKETASLKGKGGSMHLCSPERGFMGTSAIVASAIPVAVGCAFANKCSGSNRTVAVFFGDGAVEEGVFWESLNAACLMKLPVLFVCEDNDLAVHTPKLLRKGYRSIVNVVSGFDCLFYEDETTDAETIYNLACRAVDQTRKRQRPSFIRLRYYRYLEHVGVKEDFDAGYRNRGEYQKWQKRDPIRLQREKLQNLGFDRSYIASMETEIQDKVNRSFNKARQADFCDVCCLYEDVLT